MIGGVVGIANVVFNSTVFICSANRLNCDEKGQLMRALMIAGKLNQIIT